ncbi:ankyrin repeat and KH domain-containing protein 1-like isoform X2 [Lineus longissimus]|uniref:ankyrin repeat and KH domain-containing protein 1-like isoform X2 n=1 Tax=Lineus longissimus TaxID=88925 RepID=UPI002B4FB1EE
MADIGPIQEFRDAVRSNNVTKIEGLLSTIDFAKLDGVTAMTALDIVVKGNQHAPTVQRILQTGVDVNNAKLGLPLIAAITQGSSELVQLLLASGADPLKSDGQTNALACAIDTNNTNSMIIAQLLKQYDGLGNHGDSDNRGRALYAACCIGDSARVKQYCEEGTAISSCHQLQLYPLMQACGRGQTDLVKCLLEQGADVHEENSFGETALGFCIFSGSSEILEILLLNGADIRKEVTRRYQGQSQRLTPLMWACFKQRKIIQILLANGADVNAVSDDILHTTALHLTSESARDNVMLASGFAAIDTDRSVVEELLERGARPDVKDGTGRTPLDHHIHDLTQSFYYMDSDIGSSDICKTTAIINQIIISSKPHSISRGSIGAIKMMFFAQNAVCVLNIIPVCEKVLILGSVDSFLKHLIYAGMMKPSSSLSERRK